MSEEVNNIMKSSTFLAKRYNQYTDNDSCSFILKPWGAELIWAKTKDYVGKILFVTKDSKLSLQHHSIKEETMYLKSGRIKITSGRDLSSLSEITLEENESFHIPPNIIHRVEALVDSEIFEISTIELDDVIRHQDDYSRIDK